MAEQGSSSGTVSYYSMIEFIDELKLKFEFDKDFDFSILVEKSPIKKQYNNYCCKVLAVIIAGLRTIMYDELVEHDLQYVDVKENVRRKMGTRKYPFFIDWNSKVQEYKGNEFIDYSFRNPSRKDLQCVEKMRKKFNIVEPREFIGKAQHLDDKLFDEIWSYFWNEMGYETFFDLEKYME